MFGSLTDGLQTVEQLPLALPVPKEASKSYLLQHGDYLKIGGTSFLLHIHRGMASCSECSSMGISVVGAADGGGASNNESLEMQRRKGLNKLKKKYGLRLKDSFGDELHKLPENYTDKAAARSNKAGLGFSGSLQSLESANQRGRGGAGHNKMLKRYQDVVEKEKKRQRF
uniref:Uncharacterized protein n=1 Tax=Amphimedon queenslandica TaxID=400682 RepID=A0A1X7U858_AMPQE